MLTDNCTDYTSIYYNNERKTQLNTSSSKDHQFYIVNSTINSLSPTKNAINSGITKISLAPCNTTVLV